MKVACVNNKGFDKYLTKGKIYEVLEIRKDYGEYYLINNNNKTKSYYYIEWFKPLSEYRNETINNLLEE